MGKVISEPVLISNTNNDKLSLSNHTIYEISYYKPYFESFIRSTFSRYISIEDETTILSNMLLKDTLLLLLVIAILLLIKYMYNSIVKLRKSKIS